MALNPYGIASAIFLVLYAILFIFIVFKYATKQFKFKSRWSLLLFHVTIRLAAQGVGIGFAIKGFTATGLLIAALVLSAEGYFSLMLCLLRLLVSWQRRYTPERHSWLAGPKNRPELSLGRRLIESFSLVGLARSPINSMHWFLIVANTLIIVGGNLLGSGTRDARNNWTVNSNLITTSKAMRGAGQAVFLCLTIVIFGCLFYSLRRCFSKQGTADERRSRIILILMACSLPFMLTRGIFGLLQSVVNTLNYYYPGNYDATGFTPDFAVKEACLATMCEWCTCALLLSTSLFGPGGKSEQAKADNSSESDVEGKANKEELMQEGTQD